MNKRSFLYSAAFIGLVAASGAIPAQAQKGVALQPSTQWAVNKVSTESGDANYCAVARRFRPNTILTFARNSAEEASFALDFQTPKFRQAEGMQVVLDPGAGQQRGFEVYPVSNQAFVIRLGQDDDFFAALNKTGFLRVEFDGNSYNFDLADIDVGQKKLSTCLNTGSEPQGTDGDFMKSASNEAAPRYDESMQKDIDDLRTELAKLKADNQRMTAAPVETVEKEDDTQTGTVVSDQLLAQVNALEEENNELKIKLKGIDGGDLGSLRAPKDVDAIAKLTKENQDLRTALETAQAQDIQQSVLEDQVADLQAENEKLRGELTQADASGTSSEDVLKVIKENEKLKEQLAQQSGDVDQTRQLKDKITSLELENQTLKNTKAAVNGDGAALQQSKKQIEALKEENKRLQSVVQQSEVTGDAAFIVKELKGQVAKLQADSEEKQKKLVEFSKLSTEVAMLRTTNEQLEQQLIESALRGPVNNKVLTQKVAALETQNDSLLQKIQSESDGATQADAATLESLKAENEQLKKTIADNATLVKTNQDLQAQVESLRKENEDLKAKASAAAAVPGGDLQAQLQKALDDNQTLQAQLQQKEAELAELPKLREEIERLKAENAQLKAGQAAPVAAAAPGTPNPEVETLHRENENLRQQIATMGNRDSEINDLKAKLTEQEAKIAAAEEAVKKAESDAKTAQENADKQTRAAKEAKAAQKAAEKKAEELKTAAAPAPVPAPVVNEKKAEVPAPAPVPLAEEKIEKEPLSDKDIKAATKEAEERRMAKADLPPEGVEIEPRPLAPTPAVEDEMIRLEQKLSEAKASGDQMAIQQAARDYMRLKSQLSASQELAASNAVAPAPAKAPDTASAPAKGDDAAKALLNYAGTGKAPVDDVRAESTMPTPDRVKGDAQSEALLKAGSDMAEPTSAPANEAQRQEQAMSAHAAEDPYADLKVEDDFKGYESVAGGSVKEKAAEAKESTRMPGQAKLPEAPESYSGRINDSRMVTPDSVREANAKSQQLMQAEDNVAPPPSADWAQTSKASPDTASVGGIYKPGVAVPQLLSRAQVVAPAAVSVVKGASGADKVAYQWKANKVFGSAVQQPLTDPSRFDSDVQEYLAQTKERCGQDFAVVPDEKTQAGDTRIETYEIACVGKGVSSSASLIFFSQQGTFTVLAHETPTEQLGDAMEIRDKLVKTIKGS